LEEQERKTMQDECVYQRNYSALMPDAMYAMAQRRVKAEKIIAVLADCIRGHQGDLRVLDVGCSTGIMTHHIAKRFKLTVGADIDVEALRYASGLKAEDGGISSFLACDAMSIPFRDRAFDLVICAHVYEHVPSARHMMSEIHRVLKPGGLCFFSAGNRLSLMEPHYRLPFLSVMPRAAANWFLSGLGRGDRYYEKHLTYWGLKKLVSGFQVIDYTRRIIDNPDRFSATDVCPKGSMKQRFAAFVASICYWLIPTYVFVLKKSA